MLSFRKTVLVETQGRFFYGRLGVVELAGTLKTHGRNEMAYFDTLQATTEMIEVGIERSQAESIAKTIAKVQGDTVTKDYLDLRLSEMSAMLMKEINNLKLDLQFTKWTNKAILVLLGIITSAMIKIAFFQ